MPFEQMLRDRLLDEAEALSLPDRADPARAVRRARSRRHRRTAVLGVTAAVAVATAAVSLAQGDPAGDPVVMPGTGELPRTGPLDIAWQATGGGLSNIVSQFQDADGTVYALSTGPGVTYQNVPDQVFPKAVYTLAEDGTWQPLVLDGDRPRLIEMAGAAGQLYGVTTGPGDGAEETARLYASDDGGETWTGEDVTPPEPPSTAHPWGRSTSMAVESNGTTTLALVSTSFYPDVAAVFPELDPEGDQPSRFTVDVGAEGLTLRRILVDETGGGGDGMAPTTVTVPPTEGTAGGTVDIAGDSWSGEAVRTVPWADLGVTGPRDLVPPAQLFRRAGDAWEAVPLDLPGSGGGSVSLEAVGDGFLVQVWPTIVGMSRAEDDVQAYTSPDGEAWTEIGVPGGTNLVAGLGPALVATAYEGTVIQLSTDGGGTWSEFDMTDVGADPGGYVAGTSAGPLGLATVLYGADSRPESLAVTGDLVDWTVTPLEDIVGADASSFLTTFVGRDRIVVSATIEGEPPAPAVTAVGTPRRG
jgi:hypothetical protein